MTKHFYRLILAALPALLLSFSVAATPLHDAKAQGLIGEQTNGLLGMVVQSSEATAIVKQVNAKRQSHYQKIAAKNGIPVSEVAKLAAQKMISATKKGHYIQSPQGKWIKK